MDSIKPILNELLFGSGASQRYTQDSPVLPDVWAAYAGSMGKGVDLLLIPHTRAHPGDLLKSIRGELPRFDISLDSSRLAYNQSSVVVDLSLWQMVHILLPTTAWWERYIQPAIERHKDEPPSFSKQASKEFFWFVKVVGMLSLARKMDGGLDEAMSAIGKIAHGAEQVSPELWEAFQGFMRFDKIPKRHVAPVLWSINLNRKAKLSVWRSTLTIKADAARQLFNISCKDITWAVIDSGIDARHPAFASSGSGSVSIQVEGNLQGTRVIATYDFTRLRRLLGPDGKQELQKLLSPEVSKRDRKSLESLFDQLQADIEQGRQIDWDQVVPLLEVPYDSRYAPPTCDHGTHVAGILAADWPDSADHPNLQGHAIQGVCPDLRLYDLRILEEDGNIEEYMIMAALQFVRHLNRHKDCTVIHGINLSLSVANDVASYACGRTPLCEECNRVVSSGVVVVAAAGNRGHNQVASYATLDDEYRSISITDPGNAEDVITVGATHRERPHLYGCSYFSSRGPTGDGRAKPDLVAPGEKIHAPVLNNESARKDGTSMAAPHVSGAAALLMARHPELMGDPQRVKRILCDTATDLGRERYFQGHGLVDILRAIQSI